MVSSNYIYSCYITTILISYHYALSYFLTNVMANVYIYLWYVSLYSSVVFLHSSNRSWMRNRLAAILSFRE